MGRRQRRAQERLERQEAIARGALLLAEDKRKAMPEEYFRDKVAIVDKLQINGITVKELKENYDRGFEDGFKAAGEPIVKGCFAAICLAMHELHGWGRKRCCDILNAVDQHLLYDLTSDEAIEEVWKTIGLHIDFNDPFDRISEIE